MTSMSLKDCIHAVRQGFIQFIDEVIRNSKESSLACLPEFIKILWFRLHASTFILPQTCSMIFMSGDWAGQSWSTLIFFALRNFDVEMEVCDPAAKFGPFYGWECKRQLRLLDILDYCCLPPCRSLAHPHTGCNPRPWFFCHQTWLFSGWISDPCGLQ